MRLYLTSTGWQCAAWVQVEFLSTNVSLLEAELATKRRLAEEQQAKYSTRIRLTSKSWEHEHLRRRSWRTRERHSAQQRGTRRSQRRHYREAHARSYLT